MRPVQIMDKPAAAPFVCINCGAGVERQFFVDLGFDAKMEKTDENNAKYYTEGVIYLCSECITSLIVEFNRKLTHFLTAQFTSRGFMMDANIDEIRTLQNEIFMLRDRLNVVDEENQTLRYALLSKVDQENEVLSPPTPTAPTAESLVDQMLGKDTNGNGAGTTDSIVDGRDSNSEGTDSESSSDESTSSSNESTVDSDSLTATHLSLGNFGATSPPSN